MWTIPRRFFCSTVRSGRLWDRLRAFRQIGILDEFKAQGATHAGLDVHTPDGHHIAKIPAPPVVGNEAPCEGAIMRPVPVSVLKMPSYWQKNSTRTLKLVKRWQPSRTVVSSVAEWSWRTLAVWRRLKLPVVIRWNTRALCVTRLWRWHSLFNVRPGLGGEAVCLLTCSNHQFYG